VGLDGDGDAVMQGRGSEKRFGWRSAGIPSAATESKLFLTLPPASPCRHLRGREVGRTGKAPIRVRLVMILGQRQPNRFSGPAHHPAVRGGWTRRT